MSADTLLTADDLATEFGVSTRRIMEWRLAHGWPCVQVGRTFRWTPQQFEQIKAMHTVTSQRALGDERTKLSATRKRSAS